jgi:hypothetical protein
VIAEHGYRGRRDLEALDIEPATVDWLLEHAQHSGPGGQPVIPSDELPQLCAEFDYRREHFPDE